MKDIDESDELYSSMWLLQDKNTEHRFGTVCAFGPAKNAGTVRLSLESKHILWKTDEYGDVVIELSEERARQIADQLLVVVIQLEHLRGLKRLGLLAGEEDADG